MKESLGKSRNVIIFNAVLSQTQKPSKRNQRRHLPPQWTVSRDPASINQLILAGLICAGTNLNSFGSLWDRRDGPVGGWKLVHPMSSGAFNRLVRTDRWLTEPWECVAAKETDAEGGGGPGMEESSRRQLKYFWSNSKWPVRRPVDRSGRIQAMTSKWTNRASLDCRGKGEDEVEEEENRREGEISVGENRDAKSRPRLALALANCPGANRSAGRSMNPLDSSHHSSSFRCSWPNDSRAALSLAGKRDFYSFSNNKILCEDYLDSPWFKRLRLPLMSRYKGRVSGAFLRLVIWNVY